MRHIACAKGGPLVAGARLQRLRICIPACAGLTGFTGLHGEDDAPRERHRRRSIKSNIVAALTTH